MTNNEAAKWIQLYIDLVKIDPTTGEAAYLNDDARKTIEAMEMAINALTAQPEETHDKRTETHACDCISRQAAMDFVGSMEMCDEISVEAYQKLMNYLEELPSAQPERTCVNCGKTINNGGWYADGGTRCPIEEHYALPKDGYCHLWEKRNVTDDDYPERRTDE